MEGFLTSRVLMSTRKIMVEDGIYHVTQRAPGKEVIFVEDKDYRKLISLLKETSIKFSVEIFCFALLPNHLHILLKIKEKNLSEAMRYLFKKYAQWFNVKYQRKGHVFCGAYRAAFCCDERYLIAASVYIHLNPLKAQLTNNIFKYKWTSLNCYVLGPKNNSFINTKQILEMLGNEGCGIYKNLIVDIKDLKYANIINNKNAVRDFRDNFFNFFKQWLKGKNFESNELARLLDDEKIIYDSVKREGEKFEDREGFLYTIEQLRARGYTVKEIAEKLQVGRATIYRLMRQKR